MLATIRAKILGGCLALTVLTAVLGVHSQWSQRALGEVALRLYDRSFMGMSYLRSAQAGFLAATAGFEAGGLEEGALGAVLEDLGVARERAMSPGGEAAVEELSRLVAQVRDTPSVPGVDEARGRFEAAVEVFAGDGFRDRRAAEAIVEAELARGLAATGLSLVVALVVTLVLARMIGPPVRRAVQVAQAIAGGKLDNAISAKGGGETGDLLRALGVMQGSISGALERIKGLMREQESEHAGVMAAQHARMHAALETMSLGLLLFDAEGRLAVANRRFGVMFGVPQVGAGAEEVLVRSGLSELAANLPGGVASVEHDMADGTLIVVSSTQVDGGGWVATFADVTERRKAAARLARASRHDALTGLPNRLQLIERKQEMWARGTEDQLALLCLGLDRFRGVNETHGYEVGDAVLRAVAERLSACAGEQDLVARSGGDEFVIVQVGTSQPADAQALARRVAARIGAEIKVDGRSVMVSASIGVAVAADLRTEGSRLDGMLPCATLALERAKEGARGTIRFFSAAVDAQMQTRRRLEIDLQDALTAGQFDVFYQPLVQARGVAGFEALLRWRHPSLGYVSPAEFIPLAEESGLIGPIGAWVLRRACTDAAGWPGAPKVAVNLSPVQVRSGTVPAEAAAALRDSGLPASRLELEVTESVLLADDSGAAETLSALQAQGIRIAMDDFGTGFSSLSYLLRFRFDKIKIDQSFVRGMLEQEDCRTIVRTVIGLGRSLGIAVNAEGVETEAQMALLRSEGCTELQGFLFSKPMPGSVVPEMLRRLGNGTVGPEGGGGRGRRVTGRGVSVA